MRKIRKEYLFSVEGETEQWYLKHLENLINEEVLKHSDNTSVNLVYFNIKPKMSMLEVVKRVSAPMGRSSFHIFDYESTEEQHIKRFKKVLGELKYVNENHPEYNYKLGYSNFAFDLWIVLHKSNVGIKADRKKYLNEINKNYNMNVASMKNYKKENVFNGILSQITLKDVFDAIERAEKIREAHKESGHKQNIYNNFTYYEENPDTTVYECIKQILKECGLWDIK